MGSWKRAIKTTYIASLSLLCGCAGPTTPLGAVWVVKVPERAKAEHNWDRAKISFFPPRQVLHGPAPMMITIHDPDGIHADHELRVQYNGKDVTDSFLRQAQMSKSGDGKQLLIKVPLVRLPPTSQHDIRFLYGSEGVSATKAQATFQPPICNAFARKKVFHTGGFEPPNDLLVMIDQIAIGSGFNPVLATALIAQESSFRNRTVSSSKAIGLTQVTSIAETEISELFSDWPRYPGINQLPVPIVKALVIAGKANAENEWRLDSERSIRGGLAYARMLAERWASEENYSKIRNTFIDSDRAYTELLLASYNSGYTRVLSALNRRGADWINDSELTEAKRYVNRIFSFCDHFSYPAFKANLNREGNHEEQT